MSNHSDIEIPKPTKNSRLHLYVASACPFCHRVIATIALTGLSDKVTYTWMDNIKGIPGWTIEPDNEPAFNESHLSAVYKRFDPTTKFRPSVPLLVDLSTQKILSSSSTDMTHYFAKGMNGAHDPALDLYPSHLHEKINELNDWLHDNINRAVYLAGFATDQADYELKVNNVFTSLDDLEDRLRNNTYLFGDELTESDLYFFATLVRFDEIYYPLFKCSYRQIRDYPKISAYLNRLLSTSALNNTVDVKSFKEHYYKSVMHVGENPLSLNPMGTVPANYRELR